ncbi:MAG: c-type cytochrome [Halieaceae bacterium]|jgi:cytochrome c553|nr:c-type cytochrome [Halieaceae bacterium]
MKSIKTAIAGLAIALAATMATVAHGADLEAGKASYGTCAACHGSDAAGNPALNAPALAGQSADYLARQITHYQAGIRGADARDTLGRQMQGMAATLTSPEAVANVAAYIASLPAGDGGEAGEHDKRNGEVQYNANCGACHGANAQGNPALNAPNLATLDEAYLRRQYQNFQQGIRGSHPEDKYGRQMQMMSSMLGSDKDLDDVIGFILAQ